MTTTARTISGGFVYPECPRWREGRLWFSDQHDDVVHAVGGDGARAQQFSVPGGPSGLGWTPNGDLLVVSMEERRLYRRRGEATSVHADLSPLHAFHSNDMVVDTSGRAYVGNIGFDFNAGETPVTTNVALVAADGAVSLAASDLMCPNGSVITPDGKTLIIAESLANRLTAFSIDADGRLSNRRLFAALDGHVPDGLCLDAEGAVWAASPYAGVVLRVGANGDIIEQVTIEGANPYACMLGGVDGRDLFICCAPHHDPKITRAARGGRIDATRAAAPAAGLP